MAKASGKTFVFHSIKKIKNSFLEKFEYKGEEQFIKYETDEFSAVCPFSGLPDFGKLIIEYIPNLHCLELKSLKYYIISFRNVGVFQEEATNIIFNDIWKLLSPKYLKIILNYNRRGGVDSITEINKGVR
jgi:7-cyano-7-deazaguanine reductase